MFCLSLEPKHYNFIKELGYLPVGLGEKSFGKEWFSDRSGINISKKISIMENILIIIGFGKIIWIKLMMAGLVFVSIENFGA